MCGLSGSPTGGSLVDALAAIDAANADDPNKVVVRGVELPLALAHGRLADDWVQRLQPDGDDAMRLAARAHHLRRWELPRAEYPEGRPGYLQWRRDQKARHARDVEGLLSAAGYGEVVVGRVQALIRREYLVTDAAAQTVEDAACLVFLETQLTSLTERLTSERLGEVIRKTAAKMTPAGLAMIAEVPLTATERQLLAEALSET